MFPVRSVAVYVTVVTPGGNDVPGLKSEVTLIESSELSVTSGGVQKTRVSSPSREANRCWSGGQPLTKCGISTSGNVQRRQGFQKLIWCYSARECAFVRASVLACICVCVCAPAGARMCMYVCGVCVCVCVCCLLYTSDAADE